MFKGDHYWLKDHESTLMRYENVQFGKAENLN
jgi:hypothetical protein